MQDDKTKVINSGFAGKIIKNTNTISKTDNPDPKPNKDGEIEKKEEVTDKETGKKIKVITHTGPRGGKYYWPDGVSKTPENKVYVDESLLSSYLLRKLVKNK